MSAPTLTPASTLSAVVLPSTGTLTAVNAAVPYKIYTDESGPLYSSQFISGAVDQVSYVYKKLGGDVLDIELTEGNVYAAYEEAVLEYSYIVNLHQSKNAISNALIGTDEGFESIEEPTATASSVHQARLPYQNFKEQIQEREGLCFQVRAGAGRAKSRVGRVSREKSRVSRLEKY